MSLRVQQQIVYERLKDSRETILDSSKTLGERAAVIVAGGTAIATFFGAGEMWSARTVPIVLLVGSAVASLCSFVAASFVWAPRDGAFPGSLDESELWESIIDESEEVAIANMIRDEIATIKIEQKSHAVRSRAFRLMLISVWFQVILIFFAVWFGK